MRDKASLRARMRQARHDFVHGLTLAARSALHVALAERVLDRLDDGAQIASYVPTGSEADPRAIDHHLSDAGREIAYPWFAGREAPMEFRTGGAFTAGPFGIPQPGAKAQPRDPDIVLVPLLAIDTRGIRLGQGKGHYDRTLATLFKRKPLFTIGLAYDIQLLDEINADPWDIPLDAIATPSRWIDIAA